MGLFSKKKPENQVQDDTPKIPDNPPLFRSVGTLDLDTLFSLHAPVYSQKFVELVQVAFESYKGNDEGTQQLLANQKKMLEKLEAIAAQQKDPRSKVNVEQMYHDLAMRYNDLDKAYKHANEEITLLKAELERRNAPTMTRGSEEEPGRGR